MYSEPEWSQATTKPGFLEILKGGKIIKTVPVPLNTPFLTFGRLPENDVMLDHESISRKHAVLQFGPRNTAFIYDLGSSHGTFANKKQIDAGKYVKITSGNAMIRFGASSRNYILNLEEDISEESATNISQTNKELQTLVSDFFSEHGISSKKFEIVQIGNVTSVTLDYSEYVSIDPSEPSRITSSGASKEEALENFYEDSYNFLSRLGLIVLRKNYEDYESDSDISNEDFYVSDQKIINNSKKSDITLSESDVLALRSRAESEIKTIQAEIDNLSTQLHILDQEAVDDFDGFVQDLKKDELKKDIEKRMNKLDIAKNDFSKYQKILLAIGYNELSEEIIYQKEEKIEPKSIVDPIPITTDKITSRNDLSSNMHTKKAKNDISLTDNPSEAQIDKIDSADGIVDFEDSTLHDEKIDFNVLKRKYGY